MKRKIASKSGNPDRPLDLEKAVVAMASAKFRELVETNIGCAVIVAGSNSDYEPSQSGLSTHMEDITESLAKYHIPYEARVCSAHKQPMQAMKLIDQYNTYNGRLAIISVVGKTDALSGLLSYHSLHPVISCSPTIHNLSCLDNPIGSSNAYIELPHNVGRFVAQMFSTTNPAARKMLEDEMKSKIELLTKADDLNLIKHYQKQQKGD